MQALRMEQFFFLPKRDFQSRILSKDLPYQIFYKPQLLNIPKHSIQKLLTQKGIENIQIGRESKRLPQKSLHKKILKNYLFFLNLFKGSLQNLWSPIWFKVSQFWDNHLMKILLIWNFERLISSSRIIFLKTIQIKKMRNL